MCHYYRHEQVNLALSGLPTRPATQPLYQEAVCATRPLYQEAVCATRPLYQEAVCGGCVPVERGKEKGPWRGSEL